MLTPKTMSLDISYQFICPILVYALRLFQSFFFFFFGITQHSLAIGIDFVTAVDLITEQRSESDFRAMNFDCFIFYLIGPRSILFSSKI